MKQTSTHETGEESARLNARRASEEAARRAILAKRQSATDAAAQRRFCDRAAHDVKAIIRHIAIFATMIAEDGAASEQSQAHLDAVQKRAAALSDMTTMMRDIAVASSAALEMQDVRVAALLEAAAEANRIDVRRKASGDDTGVAPPTEAPALSIEGDVLVSGDSALLKRLFTALIKNALVHGLATPTAVIRATIERLGGRCRITLVDNGVGVAADAAEGYFEPFVGSAMSADPPRLGLGLTAARAIARAHGGDVSFVSPGDVNGAGCAVEVVLPLTVG